MARTPDQDDPGARDRAGDAVASWFGDDAAEARRAADHHGGGPRKYRRPDGRIEEDVTAELTADR